MSHLVRHMAIRVCTPATYRSHPLVSNSSPPPDHDTLSASDVLYQTREGWLQLATRQLAKDIFAPLGYRVPIVKVSMGFATGGLRSNAIGQCWPRKSAEDETNHIFISPSLGTAYAALDTLVHELVHAVDDCEHKHGKEFKKVALAIGLQGPMRSAGAGPALKRRLESLLARMPPYPHGRLKVSHQQTISVPPPKAKCETCGYRVTVPKRFMHLGPPICPAHNIPMKQLGDWG